MLIRLAIPRCVLRPVRLLLRLLTTGKLAQSVLVLSHRADLLLCNIIIISPNQPESTINPVFFHMKLEIHPDSLINSVSLQILLVVIVLPNLAAVPSQTKV